ncbi:MAG: hypothetical protein J3K34DRAFT_519217 [Monoraphidium minutum]|nr:MAG: hypothetical protein J3K34DRAFT_519217 [Monoraphidium minutum]
MRKYSVLSWVLAVAACLSAQPAHSACSARFELVAGQEGGTNLTFWGTSKYSLVPGGSFPVKLNDPATLIGLAGAMHAAAPAAPACPAAPPGWAALAAGGGLSLTSARSQYYDSPLVVFPEMLYANVFRLPLNISGLEMNLTLGPAPPSARRGAAATAAAPLAVAAQVTRGFVFSNTSVTGGPQLTPLNITRQWAGAAGAQFLERSEGGQRWLYLVIPDFEANFSSATSSAFRGSGTMDFGFRGRLAMRAPLNCSRDCGPRGRCVPAPGGGAGGACECECGWGVGPDGGCSAPRGFCSIYGGAAAISAAPPRPAAAAGGAPPAELAAAGATCAAGYGFNMRARTCEQCAAGFGGPGCNTCTSDAACAAKTGAGPAATCASGLAWAERSRQKHYSCSLSDPSIASVVGPVLAFSCSAVGPDGQPSGAVAGRAASGVAVDAGALVGNSPFCKIDLRLGDMPAGQYATCTGWACHFGSGEASWVCDTVTCECPGGCAADGQDYAETFKNVRGEVTLDCDKKTDKCLLNVGSLDIKIEADCQASECIETDGPILVGDAVARPKGRDWLPPVIAAVPAMALLAGAAACGAMMAGALPYVRPAKRRRAGAGAGAAGSGGAKAAGPVGEGREGGGAAPPGGGGGAVEGKAVAAAAAALDVAEYRPAEVQELSWSDLVVAARAPRPPVSQVLRRLAARPRPAGGDGADDNGGGRWKTILRGVGGAVRAREVAGVLGPSGSGKSTLLSALTGSLASDARWRVRGAVSLDGAPAGGRALARATALVPQDDLLLRSLTVEECLLYSAALRLPPALPPAAVHAKVEAVLAALGIGHVRSSTVWSGAGAAAGVSGGERRRVAIGMELVTDPQVLVLDEPTSGLDSFTALNLLRTLRAVAGRGRAVLLSLHQPSPVLFDAMDQVILMADGAVVFAGAPSAAPAAMAALGAPPPPGVSAAEHMLHAVADPETRGAVVAAAAAAAAAARAAPRGGGALNGAAAGGGAGAPPHEPCPANANGAPPLPAAAALGKAPNHNHLNHPRRSLRREFGVLFWRSLADMLRNPMLTAFHAVGGLVLGLLVGIIFYQVELNTTGAQNRLGAIFFGLALMAFTSVTSVDLIQAERHAAAREMRRSYYSPFAYSATKLVLDGVLLRALPAVLFAVPFYFLMGLAPGGGPFMTFALVFVAFNATVGALALALAAALDSPGKTVLAMNLVLLVGVLFAGFLANKESIPLPLRWITWLSVFRYAWEAMVINELKSLYLYFTAPNVSITVSMKGTVFLDIIGVKDSMLLPDIAVLVAMYAGCCAFLCFVMHWRNGRRRG